MVRKYIRGGIVVIGVALVAVGVFVFQNLPDVEAPIAERANALNDAGEFHLTTIERVNPVLNEGDVKAAIRYATEHHKKIAIAGRRHSMGGHSLYPDGVVLDMTLFRAIKTFNPEQNLLVVESGAT